MLWLAPRLYRCFGLIFIKLPHPMMTMVNQVMIDVFKTIIIHDFLTDRRIIIAIAGDCFKVDF